jgi:hypothetical protein
MASCGDFWHSINNNAGNEHQAGDGMPNGSLKTLSVKWIACIMLFYLLIFLSIFLRWQACAIYNNWWPMLSGLLYLTCKVNQ